MRPYLTLLSIPLLGLAACAPQPTEHIAAEERWQNEASQKLEQGTAESVEPQDSDISDLETQREDLAKSIQGRLTTAANDIAHCALLEYGHRPCGGPQSYLPYSTQEMSAEERKQLLLDTERYNKLVQQINAKKGMMGTCEVLPKPQLELIDGECTTTGRSSPQFSY
ncbi:hypothetical protein ACR0ST_02225 [Aliidiomarina sp. Khilg15.8]